MTVKFYSVVFFIGIVLSTISLATLRGCGRYFEMGLFWLLALSWQWLGRAAFVINVMFHGFCLVFITWLTHLCLRRLMGPTQSRLASAGVGLVAYCLLLFVLFPIRECTI